MFNGCLIKHPDTLSQTSMPRRSDGKAHLADTVPRAHFRESDGGPAVSCDSVRSLSHPWEEKDPVPKIGNDKKKTKKLHHLRTFR